MQLSGQKAFGQGTGKCKGPEAEHAYCEGRPCGRKEVSNGGVLGRYSQDRSCAAFRARVGF